MLHIKLTVLSTVSFTCNIHYLTSKCIQETTYLSVYAILKVPNLENSVKTKICIQIVLKVDM